MIRSNVVLPQPDGPRKQTSSPASIVRSIDFSATKVPKVLFMPSSRTAAEEACGEITFYAPANDGGCPVMTDDAACGPHPKALSCHQGNARADLAHPDRAERLAREVGCQPLRCQPAALIAASTMSRARSRSCSPIISGGASTNTLPCPTLNDRPSAKQW